MWPRAIPSTFPFTRILGAWGRPCREMVFLTCNSGLKNYAIKIPSSQLVFHQPPLLSQMALKPVTRFDTLWHAPNRFYVSFDTLWHALTRRGKACQNVPKHVKACQTLSECLKNRRVKACQSVSECVKNRYLDSIHALYMQPISFFFGHTGRHRICDPGFNAICSSTCGNLHI